MIAPYLILLAALVTGLTVMGCAFAARWNCRAALLAAIGAFLLIIAWRTLANFLALNADFMPAVSIGDSGCLIAGSLIPYIVGRSGAVSASRTLPAVGGALIGFVINVVIL